MRKKILGRVEGENDMPHLKNGKNNLQSIQGDNDIPLWNPEDNDIPRLKHNEDKRNTQKNVHKEIDRKKYYQLVKKREQDLKNKKLKIGTKVKAGNISSMTISSEGYFNHFSSYKSIEGPKGFNSSELSGIQVEESLKCLNSVSGQKEEELILSQFSDSLQKKSEEESSKKDLNDNRSVVKKEKIDLEKVLKKTRINKDVIWNKEVIIYGTIPGTNSKKENFELKGIIPGTNSKNENFELKGIIPGNNLAMLLKDIIPSMENEKSSTIKSVIKNSTKNVRK